MPTIYPAKGDGRVWESVNSSLATTTINKKAPLVKGLLCIAEVVEYIVSQNDIINSVKNGQEGLHPSYIAAWLEWSM